MRIKNTMKKYESSTAFAALSLVGLLSAPAAFAQTCGDVTGDNVLGAADALAVLKAAVGQDVNLVCEGECEALEPRVAALEALLSKVSIVGNNLVLTGMNFQVVSGSGETDGNVNGKGNIIIGYNEANGGDDRDGSHNLVIGGLHSYSSYGGIVAGLNNESSAQVASVLGGSNNVADGDGSVIVGGDNNETRGETTSILGGEENLADGTNSTVAGGVNNAAFARASAVSGGDSNSASSAAATVSGGLQRDLTGYAAWRGGNLFQAQ